MSDSTSVAPGRLVCPAHLDPQWRYLPLNGDRLPIAGFTVRDKPEYWNGLEPNWPEIRDWVRCGGAMAILPERSGLVIIDCDTASGWAVEGGTARRVNHHGITDLTRVAVELGQEIPPTFTVGSKSGGYHLIYRQNPAVPVTSKGHRDGWRIDVKASRNTYAVTYPTPGYTVLRDLPTAVLPEWLAVWIRDVNRLTPPTGGERIKRVLDHAAAWKTDVLVNGTSSGMFDAWCQALLAVVEASNEHGGWNNTIYWVSREFFDVGVEEWAVLRMLLKAAKPVDEREAMNVERTVSSAWRGHSDKTAWSYTAES